MGKWTILAFALGQGCSSTQSLERVRDIDGIETVDAPRGWQGATVTIDPFEDLRPNETWKGNGYRSRNEHPEHAYAFSDRRVHRVGDLDEEYPALLARALPPGAQISLGAAGATEFVVRGQLIQSTVSSNVRPVAAFFQVLGIPFAKHEVRFRVAVELYRDTSEAPIWSQTYAYTDDQLQGIFYGSEDSGDLAKAALRDSVNRAAADITAVVAASRSASGA